MFTETLKEYDDVVGIACQGRLSREELARMHALHHERLREIDEPGAWWSI